MSNYVVFNGKKYPQYQTEGFAAQFVFPFAQKYCEGTGYDIGCSKLEWCLPGAIPIDVTLENKYDAYALPSEQVDYIFSSHCLEHLPNWCEALDYWISKLKPSGRLFLYLPDYSQEYWRPWNCAKHVHYFTSNVLVDFLESREMKDIESSSPDLNNSFCVTCKK